MNYIQAIKSDESFDIFELNQSNEIKDNASKYKYLKLYLNNDKLKLIEPLVLVDMPGFDSPLELHNHAILNYLNKGIYFVVLTSIEDGNITKSVLREITNIMEFGKDFSFCLSKTNLRTENDIKAVQNIIEDQLKDYFDFNKDIVLVKNFSKRDQLSFNYVAWKHHFKYNVIPGDIRKKNDYVYLLGKHKSNIAKDLWKYKIKRFLGLNS